MRSQCRRPVHYTAICLHDGTVLAAFPVRKPTPHVIKRDRLRIDPDHVCREYFTGGREISDVNNETRMRSQDIISNALNARRAVRELVLPRLDALESEFTALRAQLDRIEQSLAG